jgi:hypothetical protein
MHYNFVTCYITFGCWLFRHRRIARFWTYLLTSKLLLVLASTVILDSEYHGTHHRILVSDSTGSLQTIVSGSGL